MSNMSDAEWRLVLSPLEHAILRESATEGPGTGAWLGNEEAGSYHCVGCGQKLYDAAHKFHSGCGWPSFFQEVEPGAITTHVDGGFGQVRTEMRCAGCGGHLGHIFGDAPQTPTGTRHCVNGLALLFVPTGADVGPTLSAHRANKDRP